MVQNKTITFTKNPDKFPILGTHLSITSDSIDLSIDPPDDGLLLKNYYISLDPFMRMRMDKPISKPYVIPFKLDEPIHGGGIAKVLKSQNAKFSTGDIVCFFNDRGLPFQEYTVCDAALTEIPFEVHNPYDIDVKHFIGKPKAGETILVSAASGAVGQLVGQLAKKEGTVFTGIVGNKEKLRYVVEELGFDAAINYKAEESIGEALKRIAPQGIDVYFDNVGGEILEAVIENMNWFGRIVACGTVSSYNQKREDKYGIKNHIEICTRRISMQGFIASDPNILKHFPALQENVQKGIADGSIKFRQDVTVGIGNAIDGLLGMLKGEKQGKAILQVADLETE
ncbi:NAD(P)-binding protein [Mytilinidion resinicola]|uniref:NAD(P)-binding protein n=1 Tax=Mytilinidion resinicola TaxID=574789 RepID=A0A6A6Y1X9_9PEZI|nr:NAD(P)-binding protein [Mytilinidion resinicola]KAF2802821.1 NAD(P)-binding protein [Mytilinidion resinicola]